MRHDYSVIEAEEERVLREHHTQTRQAIWSLVEFGVFVLIVAAGIWWAVQ